MVQRVKRRRRRSLIKVLLLVTVLVAVYLMAARWKEQEAVRTISWLVVNRVIVVDPGHGGVDPGAVGPGGSLEKDINLAISKRLQAILTQAGAVVVMTRETDTDLGTPGKSLSERKEEDLKKRLELVKQTRADLYISIQTNSLGTRWTGAQTFYDPGSAEGQRLARCIQQQLRQRLKNTDRVAMVRRNIFMLRNLEIPAAMVEVGFISNAGEERLLNNRAYQDGMAWAVYAGIAGYLAGDSGT